MFWHTARDDIMFTSMRCISRHEYPQVYGTILLIELTNQAMLESKAYQTYYAFASWEDNSKTKKKQPAEKTKAKGLAVLSKVALTKAEQLKLATKRMFVNNDGDDDDANDEDKQEGDEMNVDDEETDSDRTESDRIKIPILDQSTTEYYEEEENIDD
ncbi:hypothetical protein Tco_0945642 [Tanacetum coccineum]